MNEDGINKLATVTTQNNFIHGFHTGHNIITPISKTQKALQNRKTYSASAKAKKLKEFSHYLFAVSFSAFCRISYCKKKKTLNCFQKLAFERRRKKQQLTRVKESRHRLDWLRKNVSRYRMLSFISLCSI